MQSLLPDQRRSLQERSSVFLMVMLGVSLMMIWDMSSRNQKRQAELAQKQQQLLDEPIVKKEPQLQAVDEKDDDSLKIEETQAEPTWITLGSMKQDSPYKMLVTLTSQGAAVVRAELNTAKYRDVQEPSGYMGQIVVDTLVSDQEAEKLGGGVMVQVAGPGTPAQVFGLQAGDRIIQLTRKGKNSEPLETRQIKCFNDLRTVLFKTKPGEHVDLKFVRDGQEIDMTIILGHHPMNVIRPESLAKDYEEYRQLGGLRGAILPGRLFDRLTDAAKSGQLSGPIPARQFDALVDAQPRSDQLSFLTTFQKIDDHRLDLPISLQVDNSKSRGLLPRDASLELELSGVSLRTEPWEVVSQSEDKAVFRRTIPAHKLEMLKTYQLVKVESVPKENQGKKSNIAEGYELKLKIEVKNLDSKEHKVAYQLDGPTGLPLEGGWYARKTGPGWGVYGIRDIVVRFHGNQGQTVANTVVATDKINKPWIDDPLDYIGVDSQYFQCTLKPNKPENEEAWHDRSFPIRVGERNSNWSILTDVSFRLLSREKTLQAGDGPESRIEHEYSVFLGPKDTRILDHYGLGGTISYGWFWFVAQPLLGVLHFFHSLGLNYAMAIIALTVCVRLLMFPVSRKQAQGAIKMQQIQPELQALAEKYKDDMQARSKAQSELFKKHNYHPASGCLPLFIQLPIFIGLYKALSIDAGLYGSPLFTPAIRWCSDLSAPDMLFNWSSFWNSIGWSGFNTGQGMFSLGPYFNLLPMLTIVLFLIQQAIMMPPPTDDQSRMQRKMMQYMMIFMGFLFFKIPSGLCIYFIVSTIWGLAERRFIPKAPAAVDAKEQTLDVESNDPDENRSNRSRDRKKGRKTTETQAPKEEGFFAKLMREVQEKAAEQRKLDKANKKDVKKKKR